MKHRAKWRSLRNVYGKIGHIREDWLTPCDYLPLIDALLGDLDLDPCSTHDANQQFLRAKQIYTLDDDGLNVEAPWTGKTYLFPPTYGRCTYSKQRGTWRWSHAEAVYPKHLQLSGFDVWSGSGNLGTSLKHFFIQPIQKCSEPALRSGIFLYASQKTGRI